MTFTNEVIQELERMIDRAVGPVRRDALWRWWTCPVPGHSQGAWRSGPTDTVDRDDQTGVAKCNYPMCEHNSAEDA